jgi:outer membrane protein OmpA-like peptidoglycan-associated protein
MAEDTTAPKVSFTSPGDGATAAPVKQKINVAFSEYMDPATITGATFTLKQGATPVSGRVTSNAATATFTSFKNLEKGRPYTGIITTGARDLAGNALAKDYVWHFTAFASPKVIAVLATLENSHFAFNSAEISEDGKTILKHNVQTLKDDPKMKVLVSGYTSAAGTEEYNQKLSERRAESVKNYLVKTGGIDGKRITTIGYGESHPAKYEADPSDKYSESALANMRVIVEVIEEL